MRKTANSSHKTANTSGLWAVAIVTLACGACSDDSGKTPPKQDSAACLPTTCAAAGKQCGTMPDACGGALLCGSCTNPATCGGGGVANVCGSGVTCTPTTCQAEGKNCGRISDGCADAILCGTCTAPEVCGGAGVADVCAEPPRKDAGVKKDASSAGQCSPACLEQAGAGCCTTCGCADVVVKCYPVCEGAVWDCEMGCCFNSATLECL